MNQKILNIVFVLIIIILAGSTVYFAVLKKPENRVEINDNKPIVNELPLPQPNTDKPNPQNKVYENEYLKITVLDGWTASKAGKIAYPTYNKHPVKPAVNIIKGNYILYINPLFEHASGVSGGRFNEVADGMASVDLVMKKIVKPAGGDECAKTTQRIITNKLTLNDYYTDSSKKAQDCKFPSSGESVWFGSISSGDADKVFGRPYIFDPPNEYAITLAYKTDDVNNLPKKDSLELKQMFDDVSFMLKTLNFKSSLDLESKKTERDRTRIRDINQIQLAIEKYFDDNGSYPSSLDKVAPEYMFKVPEDPLDMKPYFYNLHISDGINGIIDKGKFDGYHIGVNLENGDNSVLQLDKDCNSITGINCSFKSGYIKNSAFNGNDLQGCDNQKNRYCYDSEN